MDPVRLLIRNLLYFRAASAAVVAGMVIATAVLAGSLMVGDSVQGSLRKLAIQRLGPVDYALVANRFFDDGKDSSLATRVAAFEGISAAYDLAPAVVAAGSLTAGSGQQRVRSGGVQILAFGKWADIAPGETILNDQTAEAVGIRGSGDATLNFTFPSKEDAPRDAVVARRKVEELSATLQAGKVQRVAVEPGLLSLFSLQGGQRTPRNAWVNLANLQEAIQQPGRANVLLAADKQFAFDAARDDQAAERSAAAVASLNNAVKKVVELKDYGLKVAASPVTNELSIGSANTYLDPPIVAAAQEAAKKLSIEPRLVTVNLVNRVATSDAKGAVAPDARALHYVIAAGVSRLDDGPIGSDEIVFNKETADQMGVKPGDTTRLDYFTRDADGRLSETNSASQGLVFKVGRIIPMEGLGADASLTPSFKGLTDAASVSDWDPPQELKIDEKLAEKDNDAYWKKHKAAPRFFIHIDAATKLWSGPYGQITSIRVPQANAKAFTDVLTTTIDPASLGFVFQPVKQQQLAASAGSTDFSMLFVGFSFFLIAAATLLVAILFRLNVEQRVKQFGLLTAVGYSPGKVRWLALAEGAVLALAGGLAGILLGVLYTWAMVHGLRTWWVGAIGMTALELFVFPKTLWTGFIFGFWVAMIAVLWAVWRLGKLSPAQLMAGQLIDPERGLKRTGRIPRLVGIGLAICGLAVLALVLIRVIKSPEIALAGGAILLAAGLTYLAGVLRPRRHESAEKDVRSIAMLGLRNANRHTARSVLSLGLIAFAAFTLITVASMQKEGKVDTSDKAGGAGGYGLIAQVGVPILGDLNTSDGRYQAGFQDPEAAVWSGVRFTPLRRWAGQDISCLNMTRATSPTILGVPQTFIDRNGFTVAAEVGKSKNPWTVLQTEEPDGPIPVMTDAETAAYILKLGVGDKLTINDQHGQTRSLVLVGTVAHSIFQSELLMGEKNFRELFPAEGGFGTLLVEAAPDKLQAVEQALSGELEPYAASVDTTAARLQVYQTIQNTYLSTFRTLGSLGLALGTIGLAVVLIRNVIERRSELSLLSALGFDGRDRARLVLSENLLLLVLGLSVGTVCALLGVTPTLLAGGHLAWGPLGLTLLTVLLLGLGASLIAVRVSGVGTTTRDMRRE